MKQKTETLPREQWYGLTNIFSREYSLKWPQALLHVFLSFPADWSVFKLITLLLVVADGQKQHPGSDEGFIRGSDAGRKNTLDNRCQCVTQDIHTRHIYSLIQIESKCLLT